MIERRNIVAKFVASAVPALVLTLANPPAAQSADGEFLWQDGWRCGKSIRITQKIVDAAVNGGGMRGSVATDRRPAFLVASLGAEHGTLLFVKPHQGQWRGYAMAEGSDIYGAYVAHAHAVIFSMWSREGPGHSFTVLNTANAFAGRKCTTLRHPKGLDFSEFMRLEDFNADSRDRATVIGSVEREGKPSTWYRVNARLGHGWGQPKRIDAKPAPLDGVYAPIGTIAPPMVVDDFKANAAR